MTFDKRFVRRLTRGLKRKVSCLLCRSLVPLRQMLGHFEECHLNFDFDSKCFLCLQHSYSNWHFERCIKPPHHVDMVPHLDSSVIPTEPAKRFRTADIQTRQMPITAAGQLPETSYLVFSDARFVKDNGVHRITFCSPSSQVKPILYLQNSHDETLLQAMRVILSFEPGRWFHLIISKLHVEKFKSLVSERTDVFIPDFYCWCNSRKLLENMQVENAEHVHLLLYSERTDWIEEVWNKLKSPDSGVKYKVMKRIKDPEHLTRALLYCSQTRSCITGGQKHYNIHRPINNEARLWLMNPIVALNDVHSYVQNRVGPTHFDLYRHDDRFTSPLAQIMERLEHFNVPFARGRLCVVDRITADDTTLVCLSDDKFVNLIPGDEDITLAKVLNLVFPDEHYVWARNRHTEVGNIVRYIEKFCEPGGGRLVNQREAEKRLEASRIPYASIDIETTGLNRERDEIIQIAICTSNGSCFSWCMVPAVPIHLEAQRVHGFYVREGKLYRNGHPMVTVERNECREAVNIVLGCLVGGQLGSKNGNSLDFPMLKKFLGHSMNGIRLVDTERHLRAKFPGCRTLKDYAERVGFRGQLHDALSDAQLHHLLWTPSDET